VVAHAGLTAELQGRASGRVREFALYGETTGEIDEFGLPVRHDWAREYRGDARVVYGHTPTPTAEWVNRTICIDTGCVYAPTGAAARAGLDVAVAALREAAKRDETSAELLARFSARRACIDAYVDAYRRYCWTVDSVADLEIAPFHLLASEGRVHVDQDHLWHMDVLAQLCAADEKCRGREYLRIIYGPEYTLAEHIERLRQRGVARKRSLALREFALGLEGLYRFVEREPLFRVHECVFGVLALESEPVDPRL
jgi:hypothetical protein